MVFFVIGRALSCLGPKPLSNSVCLGTADGIRKFVFCAGLGAKFFFFHLTDVGVSMTNLVDLLKQVSTLERIWPGDLSK